MATIPATSATEENARATTATEEDVAGAGAGGGTMRSGSATATAAGAGSETLPLIAASQAAQIRRSLRRTARPRSRSAWGIDSLQRSQK